MVHVYILDLDISNSEFNSGEFGIGDGLLKPPLLIASQKLFRGTFWITTFNSNKYIKKSIKGNGCV